MRLLSFLFTAIFLFLFLNCETTSSDNNDILDDSIVGNKPVLFLKGEDTIHVDSGSKFEEPGYEAYDTEDEFLTDSVKVGYYKKDKASTIGYNELSNSLDTFFVKYSVTDSDKNMEIKWRCIIVDSVENVGNPPVIELLGSDTVEVSSYWDYVEPGYTCIDIEDSILTDSVHSQWFQEDSVTSYDPDSCIDDTICFIRYSVVDSDGNGTATWRCVRFIKDYITLGSINPSNVDISLGETKTVTLEVDASFDVSVTNNITATIQNSTGESSLSLGISIAYATGKKGTATISISPTSTCPKDIYTVTLAVSNSILFSSKSFTVNVVDGYDENLSVVGLWIDTMPKMTPYITSDIEITIELDSASSLDFDMVMEETDTKKTRFVYSGTWTDDKDSVYLNGASCSELDSEGDTLKDNPEMCDTVIAIRKNIDATVTPALWSLRMSDLTFLIRPLNIGVDSTLLLNIPIDLKRVNTGVENYPVHNNITASTFWCGEGASGDNDFITNTQSAWDSRWGEHFGLEDKPLLSRDSDFIPTSGAFTGDENPYYFALPYNDFGKLVYDGKNTKVDTAAVDGNYHKKNAYNVVYWVDEKTNWNNLSMCKNRWIKVEDRSSGKTAYAQWEDAGPYYYNDHNYVFGTGYPANTTDSPYAGIDLSPSICLYFNKPMQSWGAADFKVNWQFVDESEVPDGPWKKHVTTRQVSWN